MEELLNLLSDGRSRTLEMLADELNTTNEDILRRIEFLERSGIIRRVASSYPKSESLRTAGKNKSPCASCSGCSHKGNCGSKACNTCMPEGGFKNMGIMWEVI